jgi:hypothetical protein
VPGRPPRVPHRRPRGPAPSPRGPPPSSARALPLLPWTAATPSSVVAPPTDDLLPERNRPSSLQGWRPPPRQSLPQLPAMNRWRQLRRRRQNRRRLRRQLRRPRSPQIPHFSLLGTHGGRGWGRRRSNDSPGLVFFFFFKKQLHVLKMWINRLWINAITWTVDK